MRAIRVRAIRKQASQTMPVTWKRGFKNWYRTTKKQYLQAKREGAFA